MYGLVDYITHYHSAQFCGARVIQNISQCRVNQKLSDEFDQKNPKQFTQNSLSLVDAVVNLLLPKINYSCNFPSSTIQRF